MSKTKRKHPSSHSNQPKKSTPATSQSKKAASKSSQTRKTGLRFQPWWALVSLTVLALAAVGIFLIRDRSAALGDAPVSTSSPAGQQNTLPATITPEEANQKYNQGVFLLDVREPSEWNDFHVPNTTLIPLGELADRVNELPKGQEIVVVCRSGNRSQQGRDILLAAGFTQVTSMSGGLNQWKEAGYPTVSGP